MASKRTDATDEGKIGAAEGEQSAPRPTPPLINYRTHARREPTSIELDAAQQTRRLLELLDGNLKMLIEDAQDSSPEADERRRLIATWTDHVWHSSEGESARLNRTGKVLSAIEAAAKRQVASPEPLHFRVSDVIDMLSASHNRALADRLRAQPGRGLAMAALGAWADHEQNDGSKAPKWETARAVLEHLFSEDVPKDLPNAWRRWKGKRPKG
jgi:hypothetical protein